MLTLEESRPLLKYLRFWSNIYVFPFHVNVNSWKLIQFPPWKMAVWRILYLISALHSLYGLLVVLSMLILKQNEIILYHLPMQFDVTLVPWIFHPAVAIALMSNLNIVTKLFNELYNESGNNAGRRHWTKMSISELLAFGGAVVVIEVLMFFIMLNFALPDMSHLLVNSSLLASYRGNIGVRVVTNCIEIYLSALWLVSTGFLLSMTALVVAKLEAELGDVLGNLRKATHVSAVDGALKTSRKLQLYLQLFNGFNCWYIYAYKTVMILGAIIHGYIGFRFRKYVVVTPYCFLVHLSALITYCGVFPPAYGVVSGQLKVRREIIATSRRVRDPNKRRQFLLKVRSLRCIGLRVGKFHEIERNSSIIFVDFVERQLVSLLLAF